jgi:predicted nucleotidyltransferase
VATPRSDELRAVAQRVADALPAGEIVLTGSVSRGVADDVSDIELLVVTDEQLSLEHCFELVAAAGLAGLDTWGDPSTPSRRVSGFLDGVPIETIWWWRSYAEEQVAAPTQAVGDALVHGVALKSGGLLAEWQAQLASVPDDLALARIEEAAQRWGGYTPAALLTIARPGETLARLEWMVDAATRVLSIVYALNRVWQPTAKRLRDRTATLQVKPEGLGERIDAALTEHDPRTALRILTQVQLDTVQLAPSGPSVDRARTWLTAALELLA